VHACASCVRVCLLVFVLWMGMHVCARVFITDCLFAGFACHSYLYPCKGLVHAYRAKGKQLGS